MNIAAYAVFRNPNNPSPDVAQFYHGMMASVVRAHRQCFPGWEMRVYHDDAVERGAFFPIWKQYEQLGYIKLVPMGEAKTLCGSMLWRLSPISGSFDALICRDLDALPSPREAAAVNEWMTSAKAIHSIHDSVSHCGLMGGTVGFRGGVFQSAGLGHLSDVYAQCAELGISLKKHGDDQVFLNKFVAPQFDGKILTHRTHNLPNVGNYPLGKKDHPLDIVGWHIGGAQNQEMAMRYFESQGTFKDLDSIDGGK